MIALLLLHVLAAIAALIVARWLGHFVLLLVAIAPAATLAQREIGLFGIGLGVPERPVVRVESLKARITKYEVRRTASTRVR